MMEKYEQIKEKVTRLKGERDHLRLKHSIKTASENSLQFRVDNAKKAREYIRSVAEKTQSLLSRSISSIVSMALAAVYDDPEQFLIEFVKRRNTVECDLLFEKDGKVFQPVGFTGGGVLSVTCFALKNAFRRFNKSNRPVIILDEPFPDVSPDLQHKISKMLSLMSQKLHMQFIIISHAEDAVLSADRVFKVKLKHGVSKVEVSEQEHHANS